MYGYRLRICLGTYLPPQEIEVYQNVFEHRRYLKVKHSILLRPDLIGEPFSFSYFFIFIFLFLLSFFFFGKRRKCLKFCKSVD